MEYFWKENKKFVIALGAGVIVFYLYWSFVISSMSSAADQVSRTLTKERAELQERMALGVPTEGTLKEAKVRRVRGEKILNGLAKGAGFKVAEKFISPAGDAKFQFENTLAGLKRELKGKSVKARVELPRRWGLDGEASEESAPELLMRLAVVERVILLAFKSGVKKISHLDAFYGETDMYEADPAADEKFLNEYSVMIKFTGTPEAVFKVLHGVQEKENYLSVSQFQVSRKSQAESRMDAEIAVSLLRLNTEKPIEPALEEVDE